MGCQSDAVRMDAPEISLNQGGRDGRCIVFAQSHFLKKLSYQVAQRLDGHPRRLQGDVMAQNAGAGHNWYTKYHTPYGSAASPVQEKFAPFSQEPPDPQGFVRPGPR